EVTEDAVLEDRDVLTLEEHRTSTFIFQDVFRYVDLDLTDVKGNFRSYKNGQPTTFYETLANGDNLELKWMWRLSMKVSTLGQHQYFPGNNFAYNQRFSVLVRCRARVLLSPALFAKVGLLHQLLYH